MSDLRLDSQKLIYHPEAVAAWLLGKEISPLELEIGLSGACNHRCIFCAVDYCGYQPRMLDTGILLKNVKALSKRGLKSINYSGEGEPLIHKEAPYIFNETKALGIEIGMSTNGVLFGEEQCKACLKSFSWVRYSIGGIRDSSYKKIHRCKEGDLSKALANLQTAVDEKHRQQLKVIIGVQLILLEENKAEVIEMAQTLRGIGVDYFTVKSYSWHPQSLNKLDISYEDLQEMEQELKSLETDRYKIYFRTNSMKKINGIKPYDCCYGLPFMVYIDAAGNLYPCIVFLGRKEFAYGNLYEKDFTEIWSSERKREVMALFQKDFLNQNCRDACRLDEINRYLHRLRQPEENDNFI